MNSKLSRRVIARAIAANMLAQPKQHKHWVQVLAAYLVEQNRVEEVDLIVNDIARELYAQDGQLLVTVTTARPLSESLREALGREIGQRTNARRVEVAEVVDADLLGGFIARTADAVMDASIRSQLKQLQGVA